MSALFDKLTTLADSLLNSNWLAYEIVTGLVALWAGYMFLWGFQ